jgi:hypothetical protein
MLVTYREFRLRLKSGQCAPNMFSIDGPVLRRGDTVLDRDPSREMEHLLVLRIRDQLEQKPRVEGRCQPKRPI